MKRFFVTAAALLAAFSLGAQTPDKEEVKTPYEFTAVKDIPATSVKDQYSSGTCWSFAGIAFLESELLRTGKGDYDLSEMRAMPISTRPRSTPACTARPNFRRAVRRTTYST